MSKVIALPARPARLSLKLRRARIEAGLPANR